MEELKWQPLQHYTALADKPNADISGVYVWGFKPKELPFIPYYVGKSKYVYWRLTDHISAILGGNYSIFQKTSILKADFSNEARKYNAEDLSKKIKFIQKERHELSQHIEYMIEHFHFTYAKINDFKTNGAEYEKAVLKKLRGKLINTRFGTPDENLNIGELPFDI